MHTLSITINDLSDTQKLAEMIASHCETSDVIFLKGDLGAGKTSFAKFFIKKLCDVDNVPSPTFNILNIYHSKKPATIYHYDLYRLKAQEELNELAIEDAFTFGITLVEWPEYLENIMLKDKIVIYFDYNVQQNLRIANLKLYGRFAKEKELLNKLHDSQSNENKTRVFKKPH